MRSIVTAVTSLSITAFSHSVGAQNSGDSAARETVLEEIVVTAQKREERLLDVPISISVLGGDALDKSTDRGVVEALNRVPGVFAPITSSGGRSGGNANIAIRGVSASTVGSGTTAYYLDSIPFGQAQFSFVPDANPYDLDRVEVLRGPQGTLYGASAVNGVVRVLTKNPDFEDFELKARASLSTTDYGDESYSADAAFNMPLVQDKLAARVVLGYKEMGGWIDKPARSEKDVNDSEVSSARVKLAAKPTDNFSVGISGWFSRTDSGAPPFATPPYDGRFASASAVEEPSSTDFDAYSLDLGYDTSLFSIRSATSYLDYRVDNIFDFSYLRPNTANKTLTSSTVFTEELLLSSAGEGPWRWTLGAMYRDAQDDRDQGTVANTSPHDIYYVESKSTAVYGELTRAFADGRYEVTAGLRYFEDKVRSWEDSRSTAIPTGIPAGGLLSYETTFKKTTPRVVLNWHPSDAATLYASYSKGFRSGIAQGFTVIEQYPSFPATDPDTLTNYEIGAKANALGGRLNFEAAVYYLDWEDVQQDTAVIIMGPLGPTPVPAFQNGGSSSGVGVDFAMMYSPVESLMLSLNVGWNDLTYDAAKLGLFGVQFPEGSRRTNSPETMAGVAVDYTVPLGSGGFNGRLSAGANYIAEQITGVTPAPPYRLLVADSVTLVRAGFVVEAPTHWTATLFVDNATNEEAIQPDPFATGPYNVVIRPRTYGVQFEYRY